MPSIFLSSVANANAVNILIASNVVFAVNCYQCEKENEKEMTYEDIEKGANEFNKFLTDQIDVCNHLKEEDKKLTETSSLKGKLGSIKKNYQELVEILNGK